MSVSGLTIAAWASQSPLLLRSTFLNVEVEWALRPRNVALW
jgi:hypothetical protein